MQFVLGLFVGTFIGMTIIGLCRCMALNNFQARCSESPDVEENQGEIAANCG